MDSATVTLRVIHVLGGAFWFGAAVVFAFYLEPTATALGEPGGRFMAHLATKRKLPIVIAIASLINIVTGAVLYWRASHFATAWITSPYGMGFTVGALAAIAAWIVGFTVSRPTIDKMAAAGQRLSAGDAEAGPIMATLARRLRFAGYMGVSFLVVAVGAMASARYL